MAKTTILIGAMLSVLGVVTYGGAMQFGAPHRSPTALIPAGFGFILLLLGYFSLLKQDLRKHLMHVAVTVSLLGFLASLPMGIRGTMTKGLALGPISQLAMAVLTGLHVVLSVRSFINVRREREAQANLPR